MNLTSIPRLPPSWAWGGIAGVAVGVAAALAGTALSAPVLLLAAVGCAVAPFLMRWRDFPLSLVLFFAYLRISDGAQDTYGIDFLFEAVVAFAVAVIVLRALRGERPFGLRRPALAFLAYFSVAGLSLLFAADQAITHDLVKNMATNVVVALVVIALLDRPTSYAAAIWTLIAAGAAMGALTVFQQVTGTFDNTFVGLAVAETQEQIVVGTSGVRAGGPVASTNFFALILVVLVPLGIDRAWHSNRWWRRAVAGGATSLIVAALLLTYSRGGMLALAVVLALLGLWRIRRPSFLVTLLVAGIVGVVMLPTAALQRLGTVTQVIPGLSDGQPTDVSITGRASEMLSALMMFRDHPVLGVGLGNYPVHYLEYSRQLGLDPRREDRSAHSLYLQIAAEGGVFGLVAFVSLLAGAVRGMEMARRRFEGGPELYVAHMVAALEIGVAGYLTASVLLHDAFPRYLWIILSLAYAVPKLLPLPVPTQAHEGSQVPAPSVTP